jgi:hypothetical protein
VVYRVGQISFDSVLILHQAIRNAVTWNLRGCNKTKLTWKVWVRYVQYSLNSSLLGHCVSSALSRCKIGVYDGTVSECEILC